MARRPDIGLDGVVSRMKKREQASLLSFMNLNRTKNLDEFFNDFAAVGDLHRATALTGESRVQ